MLVWYSSQDSPEHSLLDTQIIAVDKDSHKILDILPIWIHVRQHVRLMMMCDDFAYLRPVLKPLVLTTTRHHLHVGMDKMIMCLL